MTLGIDSELNQHGQIKCGTISVRDIDRSLALYCDFLHQKVIEKGELGEDLAVAWGASKMAGARYAILQPPSDNSCFLRLIEVPEYVDFTAATTFGWSAYEICVADVFLLAEQLENSDFKIVGPPKLVDGFTSFIPMQVFGPDGEILFLNQVNHSDEDVDLPIAECVVDQIFIVVLATPDRAKSATEYARHLGLDIAATHSIRYSLLNRAFDLPVETKQTFTMIQNDRQPFAQIDQYPETAEPRSKQDGFLPAGNSMVSVMVDSLDELPIGDQMIAAPHSPEGAFYQGRRSVVIQGAASELIELIEITS